jgi:hypothetical protein
MDSDRDCNGAHHCGQRCASCGDTIGHSSEHAVTPGAKPGTTATLCGDCWFVVVGSARAALEAAEQVNRSGAGPAVVAGAAYDALGRLWLTQELPL